MIVFDISKAFDCGCSGRFQCVVSFDRESFQWMDTIVGVKCFTVVIVFTVRVSMLDTVAVGVHPAYSASNLCI